MSAVQIITDYSCGLDPAAFPGIAVVGANPEHQQRGDPPARAAYSDAFAKAVPDGPVICLVGPYGYSAAQTAASGARNDLGRQKLNPDLVRVFNTGRSFLALGALAAALATSNLDADAAFRWLDETAPKTSMWLIARTANLRAAPPEAHLEAPGGLPDGEYALLRVKLSTRVMGGFETSEAALAEAVRRAAMPAEAIALTVSPLTYSASPASAVNANIAFDVALPLALRAWFGDCAGFGFAPTA